MKRTVLKFKMETGDHSNGASPKSLTSRGNLLRTNGAMKKTILGMAISALLILSGSLNAQTKEITGVVEDDQGLLQSASVVIKGTMTGVITGVDGKFSIKAKSSDVLVFALIGYEAKEISVGDQTFIKVKLEDAPLDEISELEMSESEKEFNELLQEAKRGDATAQCNLGWMFYAGKGVKRDYKAAVKWFRKSAKQGYAEAQYALGMMYERGLGVRTSAVKALKWYWKATKQGYDITGESRKFETE